MTRRLLAALCLLLPLAASPACCPDPRVVPDDPVRPPPVVVADPDAAGEIRAVLEAFAAAAAEGSFEDAYALLSGHHRARYSVETLRRDHEEAGSEAQALIDRLKAALASGAEPLVEGEGATFPLGGGLSIGLVYEEKYWRIDRLR
ncbi:MAG: hypothetical protein P1V51_10340 [Deltaproteobacteria bacterium]|nr:hypothetical protein [Deltaproteobacteria bacterium]